MSYFVPLDYIAVVDIQVEKSQGNPHEKYRGVPKGGVIQILPCIVVFIIYLSFLIRIELTLFIKNFYAFKINQRRNNTNFVILRL